MLADKLKGFAKDSVLYGIGDGLGRLVAIVMLPILSRVFTPADYGVIDLLSIGYYFLLMGVNLNVPSGLQKYYYQYQGEKLRTLIASSNIFIVLFASLVASLFIVFSGYISTLLGEGKELSLAIRLLAVCLPIELFFSCLQLLLRLQRKAVYFCLANISQIIMTPLLTYIFVVVLKTGVTGVFAAKLITLSLLTSVTFAIERKQFWGPVRFSQFKKLFLFAIPGYPGLLVKSLMESLPPYILATYASLTAVGLFGIAFRISKILNFYVNAFNRAWNPFAFANADQPEEKKLYEIIFKVFALSIIVLCLSLSIFAKEVLQILTPPQYHSAYPMVGGIAFYLGLRGLTLIFGTALYRVNQVKLTSYIDLVHLGIFFLAAIALVPRFQATGLIAAMDVGICIYFILYILAIRRHFPFDMKLDRLSLLLVLSILLTVFTNTLIWNLWMILILKCLILIIFGVGGSLFLLSSAEKARLRKWIRNFRNCSLSAAKNS